MPTMFQAVARALEYSSEQATLKVKVSALTELTL